MAFPAPVAVLDAFVRQRGHGKAGMGNAKPAFLVREHGSGGIDGMALGFAPRKCPRTVETVLLDQPVNFTHKQQIDRFISANASGTLLTRAIRKAICICY